MILKKITIKILKAKVHQYIVHLERGSGSEAAAAGIVEKKSKDIDEILYKLVETACINIIIQILTVHLDPLNMIIDKSINTDQSLTTEN